jgi:hypothetical protein
MRKLLFILLLLIVAVGALGLYRGWFTVSTAAGPDNRQPGVELRIDQDKIQSDAQKAKDKISGSSHPAKEGARDK